MSLQESFEAAVADVQRLPSKPDNTALLKLYGLYKQATQGDLSANDVPAPGPFDFVGRAKHEAWQELAGQSPEAAMQAYIDFVQQLRGA